MMRFLSRIFGYVALLSLAASADARAGSYQLGPGDVVEVAVQGFPELRQRQPIGVDGTITLKPGGTLDVGGLTLPQLTARVQQAMTASALRHRGLDGNDDPLVLEPDEITAVVAEYRPIYVTGDVARSGEQPFRPGLSVRQAIAIAGGVGAAPMGENNVILGADLANEYRVLWTEYVYHAARVWRLKVQLGSSVSFDRNAFVQAPVDDATITRALDLEKTMLQAVQASQQREEFYLKQAIEKTGATVDLVRQQQKEEAEGTQADAQDLQTVLALMSKGNVTNLRVNEARRAVLLASTRKLQSAAEFLRLTHQQDELSRQLAQLTEHQQVATLQELQTAQGDCDTVRAKLRGLEDKMRFVRNVAGRSDLEEPTILLFRGHGTDESRIVASEQTELQPGDVLRVTIPLRKATIGRDGS